VSFIVRYKLSFSSIIIVPKYRNILVGVRKDSAALHVTRKHNVGETVNYISHYCTYKSITENNTEPVGVTGTLQTSTWEVTDSNPGQELTILNDILRCFLFQTNTGPLHRLSHDRFLDIYLLFILELSFDLTY
jgi:hypothetical protein